MKTVFGTVTALCFSPFALKVYNCKKVSSLATATLPGRRLHIEAMLLVVLNGRICIVDKLHLHFFAEVVEHLLDVLVGFGAALYVLHPIGLGKVGGLLD